ncbi:hypothetical protein CY34DRAFT_808336 [Suillus luteus UH-Slu-Lm8-n1]|uniref:Uncharacterized protein n=1 Tax=Suillus luteus UH-Slu-Lm8-n1 TaxID=930992 RepID=A0A0D0AMU7_9AGAM|nr:hypothetical protein CY34DRAFT_808336 [Suillus luteus UH-Slu-Lm8-n1]
MLEPNEAPNSIGLSVCGAKNQCILAARWRQIGITSESKNYASSVLMFQHRSELRLAS